MFQERHNRSFHINFFIILALFLLASCEEKSSRGNGEKHINQVPTSTEFHPFQDTHTRMIHGQTIYVPIYSSIYNRYQGNLLHLTSILSIRNISPKNEIIISQVDYFDTNGKLIRRFIDRPFKLGKMSTKDFVIPESDLSGGTGANFIVKWESKNFVAVPIIEAVMIGELGTKGFSFTSRGKEIESH